MENQRFRNKLYFLGFLFFILALGSTYSQAAPKGKIASEATEGQAERKKLILAAGEDKIVDLNLDGPLEIKQISIGNPKVVLPTPVTMGDKKQLVLKPLSAGTSSVTIRDAEGNVKVIFDIVVSPTDLLKTATQLRELLSDIEGIDVKIRGDKIFIDGEVLVPADYGRLFNVVDGKNSPYTDIVVNLVTLSPIALGLLSKRIQQDVNSFAPSITTRVVNGQIWIEGTVPNREIGARVLRVSRLYLPAARPADPLVKDKTALTLLDRQLVQNFIVVDPPPAKPVAPLIRLTMHFVELSKDYRRFFGFKWQPGFTPNSDSITIGAASDAGAGSSFTATISSLFPKLESAQSAGFARILKTGTLIVRSGESSQLRDELDIPFAVQAPNGQVAPGSKQVGLNINITPRRIGQSDQIEMDIDMDQKNLTGQFQGTPITSQHKIKTSIYVKSTDSAAIAAVNSADVRTQFNNDPKGENGNTALFTLLRSKNYENKKSQFVIFVTPQLLENASEGTKDLKKNFRIKTS